MVSVSSNAQRHFQPGRGVYTCGICQRRTRETTVSGSDACADCFELCGLENAKLDGCFTEADRPERDRLLALIVKKGGSEEAVKAEFRELFAA